MRPSNIHSGDDPIGNALPLGLPEVPKNREIPSRLQRKHPGFVPRIYTHPDTLLVAFAFECNLACTFCMVEDALGEYPGTPLNVFADFAADAEAMRGITRVILSGGEVTLDRTLLQYVEVARKAPGVENVRIQTNATRLHDRAFLDRLISAGVNEFFVSLHGHDSDTCDAVTQRPGSFRAIRRGIEAIAQTDAKWISNTCIVSRNVATLTEIVELAADHGASGAELWNVWPRMDDAELREEIVPVATIAPQLQRALDRCEERGLPTTVKWFPKCLLGRHAARHDDSQPTALIDAAYWSKLPGYSCLFSGVCSDGQNCAGLSHAYVERHGWEAHRLAPNRDLRDAVALQLEGATRPAKPAVTTTATNGGSRERPHITDTEIPLAAQELGLKVGDQIASWQLVEVSRAGDGARLKFTADSEAMTQPPPTVYLRLTPSRTGDKSLRAVHGWSISYEKTPDASLAVSLVNALGDALGGPSTPTS